MCTGLITNSCINFIQQIKQFWYGIKNQRRCQLRLVLKVRSCSLIEPQSECRTAKQNQNSINIYREVTHDGCTWSCCRRYPAIRLVGRRPRGCRYLGQVGSAEVGQTWVRHRVVFWFSSRWTPARRNRWDDVTQSPGERPDTHNCSQYFNKDSKRVATAFILPRRCRVLMKSLSTTKCYVKWTGSVVFEDKKIQLFCIKQK